MHLNCVMHRMATNNGLHSSSLSNYHTLPLRSTRVPVHAFLLLLAPKLPCFLSSVHIISLFWPSTLLPGTLPSDTLVPVICMSSSFRLKSNVHYLLLQFFPLSSLQWPWFILSLVLRENSAQGATWVRRHEQWQQSRNVLTHQPVA